MMRILIALLLLIVPATAQHSHDRHHSDYLQWQSGVTENCCNNKDCGALSDSQVREASSGPQVLIAGEWCPVRREHYITRGKSPDWNTAHACIGNSIAHMTGPPCARLLCFTGKGGF